MCATGAPMIAPSILSADFANLAAEAQAVGGPGADRADWLHVDVMDAHFVPNLTLGLPVVESLLKATDIPLDCHLMIENPQRWAPPYAEAGAHNVTFHAEATDDPLAVARDIRAAGAKAGLSIKPGTPLVEIDGGINADTIEQAAEAGIDCFVAGSAVYGADDPGAAVAALRDQALAARTTRA